MRILYISSTIDGIHSKGIYSDLLEKFEQEGHQITVAYAHSGKTDLFEKNNILYLAFHSLNMVKNKNMIEKGLATILFDYNLRSNLKKHLEHNFDLVLYSTPPITFSKTLRMLKKRKPDTVFYLMLKDVFPQNAVDIGIIKKGSILHRYFLRKESNIYDFSSKIGVMSEENKKFVLDTHPYLSQKIEVLPNTLTLSKKVKSKTKSDFGLPEDKIILLYGGNLGLPQTVPFILECFEKISEDPNLMFVISGSGAMDYLIKDYICKNKPTNLVYFDFMQQDLYDELVSLSDVGLIFLDYRFTVPNYPQRLLSYISNNLPVICATDLNTDIGRVAEKYNFGFFTPSNDSDSWVSTVNKLTSDRSKMKEMGINGFNYLAANCTSDNAYKIIINSYNNIKIKNSIK